MRLFLIFEEVPFFMPDLLRRFLDLRGNEVVGLTPSFTNRAYPIRAAKGETFFSYARKHPFVFGPKALTYYGAKTAYFQVINQMAVLTGRNSPYSVAGVARSRNIPVLESTSVNDQEYLIELEKFRPDIICSICGQIFKKPLLQLPELTCLNVHTSILPSYKGCYPALYSLLNSEPFFGVSCHVMKEKIDEGVVVAQERFAVRQSDTVTSLYARVYGIAHQILDQGISNWQAQTNFPDVSDIKPSYFGFPEESDFARLFSMGRKFL